MIRSLQIESIENFEPFSVLLGPTLLREESELRDFGCYPSVVRIEALMPEVRLLANNKNLMNLKFSNFYLKFP